PAGECGQDEVAAVCGVAHGADWPVVPNRVPIVRAEQVYAREPHARRRLAEIGERNGSIGPAGGGLLQAAGRDPVEGPAYPGLAPGVSPDRLAERETGQ